MDNSRSSAIRIFLSSREFIFISEEKEYIFLSISIKASEISLGVISPF